MIGIPIHTETYYVAYCPYCEYQSSKLTKRDCIRDMLDHVEYDH